MPALSLHRGRFGSQQPGGAAACAKPSCFGGGNEGWLGSVEMRLSPLSPCPTPGRWEHWAGPLLHCWGSPLGSVRVAPGEMLMMLMWSAAQWVLVRGSGEGQGCPGSRSAPAAR